jgi:hypothetical protein
VSDRGDAGEIYGHGIETISQNVKNKIRGKYFDYIQSHVTYIFPVYNCPYAALFMKQEYEQLSFDIHNLNLAIDEITHDIRFMAIRRGNLISHTPDKQMLISNGKLAGIAAFRLSRRQIIQTSHLCVECDIRCMSKINTEFAIRCAMEFIKRQFEDVNEFIQAELFYVLTSRHVNQETLALVFDTIRLYKK